MPPSHSHMEENISNEIDKKRRLDLSTTESNDHRGARGSDFCGLSKKATTEAAAQAATNSVSVGTKSQWIFSRYDGSQMVLRDNLGDTSAMLESLTHQVDNWSLAKKSSPSSNANKNDETYKKKSQDARREVMRTMLNKNVKMNG